MYLSLGDTESARQMAYRRWFNESIPEGEWDMIRSALQRNWAYGNNRFKEELEGVLGRRFVKYEPVPNSREINKILEES